jgi:hypothetical protein
VERLNEEHRHLSQGVRIVGAVVPSAAAARDLLGGELLDPVGEERRTRNVGEEAPAGRRSIGGSVFDLEVDSEDRSAIGPGSPSARGRAGSRSVLSPQDRRAVEDAIVGLNECMSGE